MIELLSQPLAAPAPAKASTADAKTQSADAPASKEQSASFSQVLSEETQSSAPKGGTAPTNGKKTDAPAQDTLVPGETVSAEDALVDIPPATIDLVTSEPKTEPLETETKIPVVDEGSDNHLALPQVTENSDPRVEMQTVSVTKQADVGANATPSKSPEIADAKPSDIETADTTEIEAADLNVTPIGVAHDIVTATAAPVAAAVPIAIQTAPAGAPKPAPKLEVGGLKEGAPLKMGEGLSVKDPAAATQEAVSLDADASINADASAQQKDILTSSDASASKPATTTASFDQLIAAQSDTQPAENVVSAIAAKAVPNDMVAAKPVPEVLVQVPQQRADMAAKQVGIELGRQVKNGDTQFVIRMDPPELGKLDVRLTINKAGEIQGSIVVEREATLDLLARDVKALERSLADAGLKMDQNAMNFSLKQQNNGSFGDQLAGGSGVAGGDEQAEDDLIDTIDSAALAQMQISSGRPLDVVV